MIMNRLKSIKNRKNKTIKESTNRMRKESGEVNYESKFTCFIYLLGRDYLPLGSIENIMADMREELTEYNYTNGWLANYANTKSWGIC